jgi:peptidoglycan/xylan/chitin deacetylase (PgdA/CDA1 family)
MIGVIAEPNERDVVREFFELFKTPWEWYREDREYEVVLCAGESLFRGTAKLALFYAGTKISADSNQAVTTCQGSQSRFLRYKGDRIPIYGNVVIFPGQESRCLKDEDSEESAVYLRQSGRAAVVRVGYDLFGEIRKLLIQGQPAANAKAPTLELHIALLRDLITEQGIRLIEIPPVPDGYPFIACLTHDVDHPSIRQHKWDHTVLGFLYRAVFGSVERLISGRITVRDLFKNWTAALKLPFVQAGFGRDFWRDFDDRYLELENGLHSTFFVIPFKDAAGKKSPGNGSENSAPPFRAARYSATELSDALRKLVSAGCEIGLHGIDAWCDSARGGAELEEIRRLTGESKIGVRMHWLYYDQQSPLMLERAEAAYDSTIGYNETVGYRAGTTQVYKPLGVSRLLELPLHVMDTAMFYPAHLGLSTSKAKKILGQMVDNAFKHGGCLTVNWHDRSLAPERLWYASYRDLVEDLKGRGVWFATAGQAVAWYKKRRSVVFDKDDTGTDKVCAGVLPSHNDGLPGLRLRIHKERKSREIGAQGTENYFDLPVDESVNTKVLCGVNR